MAVDPEGTMRELARLWHLAFEPGESIRPLFVSQSDDDPDIMLVQAMIRPSGQSAGSTTFEEVTVPWKDIQLLEEFGYLKPIEASGDLGFLHLTLDGIEYGAEGEPDERRDIEARLAAKVAAWKLTNEEE